MLFNSIDFLIFFPIVISFYFFISKKIRYIWLLVASYYFYMGWNPKYAILLGISTVITYFGSIFIEKHNHKRTILTLCIVLNLMILCFFKYWNFMFENLYAGLNLLGMKTAKRHFDIVLPVGISFYIFQALSYIVDVYRGEIKAEKNILKYALFVSFFPQLVAGPIERSSKLLLQVQKVAEIQLFNYKRITQGLIIMLWGYFLKIVIADRISIFVDNVYNAYYLYGSIELILATIGFAIQIYCDFSGYSTIAIGAAQVMGFELMENFNTPYFARSIREFWQKWHISLSSWFKDYVYIPLGGSRCSKIKGCVNVMITMLLSGLWHGASWSYVIWGGCMDYIRL